MYLSTADSNAKLRHLRNIVCFKKKKRPLRAMNSHEPENVHWVTGNVDAIWHISVAICTSETLE